MSIKEIEKRYAKGYDLTRDTEVNQLFDDMEWLMDEAIKAKRYEKVLEQIYKTSGNSMTHKFSKEGHEEAVFIAEKTLVEL